MSSGIQGQLGSATFGRYGENVYVNAATGNLAINRTDEILIGQGPDDVVGHSYNSLDDGTYGNSWRFFAQRSVFLTSGVLGEEGSTATRIDWDGSRTVYTCDASGKYISTDSAGAYDTMEYLDDTNQWHWTDRNTQLSEYYDYSTGHITSAEDTDHNKLIYDYDTNNLLTSVTTTDETTGKSELTTFVYDTNNISVTSQYFADQAAYNNDVSSGVTEIVYNYDSQGRLSSVDSSTSDGNVVTTTYTYAPQIPSNIPSHTVKNTVRRIACGGAPSAKVQ